MPPIDRNDDPLSDTAGDVGDVAGAICQLAWLNGVTGQLEPIDPFVSAATRLADTEVTLDSVERLLLGLARAGVLNDEQRFAAHAVYLRQIH